MRQIPSEGEFCGECHEFDNRTGECRLYGKTVPHSHLARRLLCCKTDKPQVMTEAERQALYQKGILASVGLLDRRARKEAKP